MLPSRFCCLCKCDSCLCTYSSWCKRNCCLFA